MPALGRPMRPTSAMTFSSRTIQRSSPGCPFSHCRGARLVDDLKWVLPCPPRPPRATTTSSPGCLQVAEQVAAVAIADQGPRRDLDDQVRAAAAEAVGPLAVLAPLRPPVPLMREVGEVGQALDGPDHDVAAAAAVAAVGAAPRRVLLAAEAHAAVAAGPPRSHRWSPDRRTWGIHRGAGRGSLLRPEEGSR